MNKEEIFKMILDCAFRIHSALGPGLLESAYVECLSFELKQSGLNIKKQIPLPLIYREVRLEAGYRLDILVEDILIIEVKSIEAFAEIHMAQILTYLKLTGCRLGLLVNFNVEHLKFGIKRVVL